MPMIPSFAEVPDMGRRIRLARKSLEMGKARLAGELGVGRGTVARWESGQTPRPRNIRRMKEFFDNNDLTTRRGIFCLETVWFGARDRTSVRPVLQFLENSFLGVPFLHYSAVTKDELFYQVDEWAESVEHEYPILYLSYHGQPGSVSVVEDGEEAEISIGEIADALEGKCNHRVVHFASCGTLNVARRDVEDFLWSTGASAVSGYKKSRGRLDGVHGTRATLLATNAAQDSQPPNAKCNELLPNRAR